VENIAPNLVASVPAHLVKVQTVKDGLDGSWLRDCGPDLGEAALAEFFILWQVLAEVQLSPDREDKLRWCWSADRVYSVKSSYSAFFAGRMRYTTASQIWRSRAPMAATSSRGSSLETDVGRLIAWSGEVFPGRQLAPFVIRSQRRSSTCF
jgi:hypothetical protein